jgi:hypothetical protein
MMVKARLQRIDDSFDAADTAHPRNEAIVPAEVGFRAAAHLLGPLGAVVNDVRDYFSQRARDDRLEALITALREMIERLTSQVEGNAKAISEIQSRLESPQFTAAFREACIQTAFTSEPERASRFGIILGNSLIADRWLETSDDLPSFIKEIARLDPKDIRILQLLRTVFADVIKTYPNMHDPNPFTERQQDLLKAARDAGFEPDDLYSHCKRLEGFGLAIEVLRNPGRMNLGDYCFRPTRRGLKLLSLL